MIELETSGDLHCGSNDSSSSSFENYESEVSYEEFFRNSLEKNKPCIFGTWLTQNWLATSEWVNDDGRPDCHFLSHVFGGAEVPVANCEQKHFDSQEKQTFILEDYLKYYRQKQIGQEKKCLYLKDWHFVRAFPEYKAYRVPLYFASDWLNEFWAHRTDAKDDYRFVYIGPKRSWTPFHADVFRSFSWSANICGRKRWVFYPPSDSAFLRNRFGHLVYDIESPELRDTCQYPELHLATGKVEIVQERGQTIFVPSNWYHQVWNLEDTISINHNWINGTNIGFVLDFFLSSLKEVEKAIEDCREMDGWVPQCQLILKSTHGMDVKEFYHFLRTISIRRINYLKGDVNLSSFPDWRMGKNHVIYDVRKLIWCLERLFGEVPLEVLQYLEEEEEENPSVIVDQLESLI